MTALWDYYHRYGFAGIARLVFSLLVTKIFYPNCKLIRMPIDVRGKRHIDFGVGLVTGKYCRIECSHSSDSTKKLIFGDNVQINDRVHIDCLKSIKIHSNVTLASGIYIGDNKMLRPFEERKYEASFVEIGENTWIGENAVILPGVVIGRNSVIGAGAVVTKSCDENSTIVGNPGRKIR